MSGIGESRDELLGQAIAAIPIPERAVHPHRDVTRIRSGQRGKPVATEQGGFPLRIASAAHRVPGRRAGVLVAAMIAVAALAGGLALAGAFDTHTQEPASQIVTSKATSLFTYQTSWGQSVTVWTAPTPDGRTCAFFPLIDGSAQGAFSGLGPSFCPTDNPPGPNEAPNLTIIVSYVKHTNGTFSVLAEGAAAPSTTISDIKLLAGSGSLPSIESKDGYFVAELPGVTSARDQLPSGGPFSIAGTDTHGATVVRRSLTSMIQGLPSSP